MTVASWMRRGACLTADPELFFPDKGDSPEAAKAVCAGCPVRAECLAYALDASERFGVWGGMSANERKYLRRTRRQAS